MEIMIDLQGGAKAPLYEKIYESIKNEIVSGNLLRGEKLPSTRRLAQGLSVSRSTVDLAYEQLRAEGYIKAEPCRGFFVCDITGLYSLHREIQKEGELVSRGARALREDGQRLSLIDFSPYAVDTENFPYNIWRRLSKNVLLDDREELLLAGDGQGGRELRETIAAYLHQARGVNCLPDQIIVGAGNEYLEILLSQILGREQTVLMEDPGYPQAYRTFLNTGYEVITVPALEDGLCMREVRGLAPSLVYVMPSHQFPVGSVMTLGKRLELLEWAAEREGRYLIEDDHDSEYRYRGKPIPSLQSIDRFGRVIYLGTFSKSIAPSLRISYLVLPPKLLERYHCVCGFYAATVPRIQQELVNSFIREGHFERHLNKMRGIYRARHDFLLAELKKRRWVRRVVGEHAGLHLLVEVQTQEQEQELCRRAEEFGVRVSGIRQYYLGQEEGIARMAKEEKCIIGKGEFGAYPVLLLGYGRLCERELAQGLEGLDAVFEGQHFPRIQK